MSKTRLVVVALFATVAISATTTSSASAAGEWFVAGSKLTTSAALATAATLSTAGIVNSPAIGLRWHCLGPILIRATIHNNPVRILITLFIIHRCLILIPIRCSIPEELSTEPLEGTPSKGTGSEVKVAVKPKSGKTFVAIPFEGVECPLAGEKPINGEVVLKEPSGQTEEKAHILEGLGSVENDSLEVGGNKAYLESGPASVKLESGQQWSLH